MISLLHIENIAVIEKTEIEFGPGLNVLTGETGAGKSIVIDALSAVTGGRVTKDLVRSGAAGATVTAVFTGVDVSSWCEENGIEPGEDGEVFLMRRFTPDGKNVCRVNGCPVTVAQLKELGGMLVDIHGQNDGRKLLDEASHLRYLDRFGGLEREAAEYAAAYRAMREMRAQIEKLTMDEGEKERRLDSLRFQIAELDRAGVRPGEFAALSARRELLRNSAKLTEALDAALEALSGGEGFDGACALIGEASSWISSAAHYAESLGDVAGRLKDLMFAAEDISEQLRDFRAELEFSPEELDGIEERLEVLRRLMKKYGQSEEELISYREKCLRELDEIEFSSDRLQKLERELEQLFRDAAEKARALSEKRRRAAALLEERIRSELSDLSMVGVRFAVEFKAAGGERGLSASGCDEVRFLMSANAGEEPGRISRVASGGELSRIMLAMKNVMIAEDDAAAMVFDEVDAGVSGIAAQRVAEKLAALSRARQVLCVTHLPQIAAMADRHFAVEKRTQGGRTYTYVTELDRQGRRAEIARLTGGENVTKTTLLSAEEQLSAAEKYKLGIRSAP